MVKIYSLFMVNLLTSIRYKINFIVSSLSLLVPVLPALLLLFNGETFIFGFNNILAYTSYLFIATTVWSGIEIIWSFTFQMRNQMREGVLDETLMQPLSISELIIGWTMDGIISTVIQSIPLLIVSFIYLITNQSLFTIIVTIFVIIITYFSGYCLSTILVAIMLNWKETDQFVSFIANIAPFVCGVIVPLKFIPFPINYVGLIFPFTWALDIIRCLLYQSSPIVPFCIEIIIFISLVLLYYFLGKKIFRYLYNLSRKKGGVIGY